MTGQDISPDRGALSVGQRQRIECLRAALALVAGRNIHIGWVWRLARWLNDGSTSDVE